MEVTTRCIDQTNVNTNAWIWNNAAVSRQNKEQRFYKILAHSAVKSLTWSLQYTIGDAVLAMHEEVYWTAVHRPAKCNYCD